MSFLLSLFAAVAVQKNIRDLTYFSEEEPFEKGKLASGSESDEEVTNEDKP